MPSSTTNGQGPPGLGTAESAALLSLGEASAGRLPTASDTEGAARENAPPKKWRQVGPSPKVAVPVEEGGGGRRREEEGGGGRRREEEGGGGGRGQKGGGRREEGSMSIQGEGWYRG